ncbi:hypothetical protein [Phenylobacterium sp.]|uniref:hypothetical protein n=1 Tax=Phenylobacterium sp. TaxID=1871053 RepID=UPI00301C9E0A
MAKVKIEWVKLGRFGETRDPAVLEEIVGEPQLLDAIGAEPRQSAAAPAWPAESRQTVDRGFARVTVLEGAVLMAWGPPNLVDPTLGILHFAGGGAACVSLRTGHRVAFIAAEEAPAGPGGLATEATLSELVLAATTQVVALPPRPRRTDLEAFLVRTPFEVAGADADELLAADGEKRHFVYAGWLQSDIDVAITFLSDGDGIVPPIDLKAGQLLDLGDLEEPQIYTAAGEALGLHKSTAATIRGVIFTKAV